MANAGKAKLYPYPWPAHECNIHTCRNRSAWYVGDPEGPASVTFVLCNECAKNLLATAPAKLHDGGPELVEKVKAEFEQEKGVYFAQELQRRAHEVLLQEQKQYLETQERLAVAAGEKEELPFADPIEEYVPETEEEVAAADKIVFRCLECEAEFPTKKGLSAHMRTHKEG